MRDCERDKYRNRIGSTAETYHCVGNIRVRRPNVALYEQRTQIRTPGIPRPSQYLLQEPPVRLHRTEKLGLLATLHVCVPPMTYHPPGQELVVARVELILPEPVIVRETIQEIRVPQDDSAVRSSASRQTWDTAIDVRRARNLDVPDRKPESGENLPDGHAVAHRLHALGRAHTPNLLVLEAGKDRG